MKILAERIQRSKARRTRYRRAISSKRYLPRFLILCGALLIGGCAAIGPMEFPDIKSPEPWDIGPDRELEPIVFTNGIVTICRGVIIGHIPEWYAEELSGNCNYNYAAPATINGRTGRRFKLADIDGELSGEFYQTMTAAGYNVVGNPDILFKRHDELGHARYHSGRQSPTSRTIFAICIPFGTGGNWAGLQVKCI